MHYREWKRKWFSENFVNSTYDWLYFPDQDKIISYHADTGIEVQMSTDYWKEFSMNTYASTHKSLTVDQKLDKIINMLENRNE